MKSNLDVKQLPQINIEGNLITHDGIIKQDLEPVFMFKGSYFDTVVFKTVVEQEVYEKKFKWYKAKCTIRKIDGKVQVYFCDTSDSIQQLVVSLINLMYMIVMYYINTWINKTYERFSLVLTLLLSLLVAVDYFCPNKSGGELACFLLSISSALLTISEVKSQEIFTKALIFFWGLIYLFLIINWFELYYSLDRLMESLRTSKRKDVDFPIKIINSKRSMEAFNKALFESESSFYVCYTSTVELITNVILYPFICMSKFFLPKMRKNDVDDDLNIENVYRKKSLVTVLR